MAPTDSRAISTPIHATIPPTAVAASGSSQAQPAIAPPMPTSATTEESASERWWYAFAIVAAELHRVPTSYVRRKSSSFDATDATATRSGASSSAARGAAAAAGWSAASSARPEWRVIAPPVASSIPAIPSAPACSARPVVAQHTASEIRSLNECAPSATSAADPLSRPMASLNAESSTLVSAESAVTDVGVIRRARPRTREPRRSDGRRFGAVAAAAHERISWRHASSAARWRALGRIDSSGTRKTCGGGWRVRNASRQLWRVRNASRQLCGGDFLRESLCGAHRARRGHARLRREAGGGGGRSGTSGGRRGHRVGKYKR